MGLFGELSGLITGAAMGLIMVPVTVLQFIAFAYFIIVIDRRNENSKSKGDNQVGIKLALHAISTLAVVIASGGVTVLLAWALSGGEGGKEMVKSGLAMVLGSVGFAFICRTFLAQTNNASFAQTERFSMGALVIGSGLISMITLIGLLFMLFFEAKWKQGPAQLLAAALVYGNVFFWMLKAMLAAENGGWTGFGGQGGGSRGYQGGAGQSYGGAPYQSNAGYAPTAYPQPTDQQPSQGYPAPQGQPGHDPNRR